MSEFDRIYEMLYISTGAGKNPLPTEMLDIIMSYLTFLPLKLMYSYEHNVYDAFVLNESVIIPEEKIILGEKASGFDKNPQDFPDEKIGFKFESNSNLEFSNMLWLTQMKKMENNTIVGLDYCDNNNDDYLVKLDSSFQEIKRVKSPQIRSLSVRLLKLTDHFITLIYDSAVALIFTSDLQFVAKLHDCYRFIVFTKLFCAYDFQSTRLTFYHPGDFRIVDTLNLEVIKNCKFGRLGNKLIVDGGDCIKIYEITDHVQLVETKKLHFDGYWKTSDNMCYRIFDNIAYVYCADLPIDPSVWASAIDETHLIDLDCGITNVATGVNYSVASRNNTYKLLNDGWIMTTGIGPTRFYKPINV